MSAARFGAAWLAAACALALALGCVPGCNSTEVRTTGTGPMSFAADAAHATGDGASVVLRSRPLEIVPLNHVVVDVVARGAADLHGAAFRVTWDPETLTFVEAQSAPVWSKQLIALAKEGAPGQLAVVWAEKGETSLDATSETVLGTLTFELRSRKSSPLTFMQERAQVVDKLGAPVAVTWQGGVVAAR
jgi:hypothetical protein